MPALGTDGVVENGGEKRSAAGEAEEGMARKKSCLPPVPTDMAAHTAIWDDVCLMAQALAEATPDDDCLQKSLILSEEEFYRQRLARVTNLLGAYQAELGNLEQMLAAKTADLRSAVQAQGLPHARLWGLAYPGWIASEGVGKGPSDKNEPGSCAGTWGANQEPCGMACLPFSAFCHECILNDPWQTLYTKDPDRGRPVMRNPTAAQMQKVHSEQMKADDGDGLSLQTSGLERSPAKINTPDRNIAAGLLAACMPFSQAAMKDRSASLSANEAGSAPPGGVRDATAEGGSSAAAPGASIKMPGLAVHALMQHAAAGIPGMHPAQFFAMMGHAFPAALQVFTRANAHSFSVPTDVRYSEACANTADARHADRNGSQPG